MNEGVLSEEDKQTKIKDFQNEFMDRIKAITMEGRKNLNQMSVRELKKKVPILSDNDAIIQLMQERSAL